MSGEMKTAEWKGTKEELIEVSANEILNAIAEGKSIRVEYAIIKGSLDIREVTCQLNKNKDNKIVIPGSLSISESTFSGQVCFVSASFSEKVKFDNVIFNEKVYFFKATFNKEVRFISSLPFERRTTFRRKTDFRYTTFSDKVDLSYAIFKGDVSFNEATFSGKLDFDSVIFGEEADFNYTTFSREVSFLSAQFSKSANFLYVKMDYPANFAEVGFHENTVRVGLKNYILCPFVSWLTRGKVKLSKRPETDFSNFNTETIMDGSSNPYLKRYIDDEQWIQSWRNRGWWRKFLFVIWELTSHCGRSIGLWAGWSLFFAVIFGLIYAPLSCPSWIPDFIQDFLGWADPQIHIDAQTFHHPIWTSIYFSIVTFTTLGFGDVQPENGAGVFWVGFEVILGYIMLGGLISIFANKFARRS